MHHEPGIKQLVYNTWYDLHLHGSAVKEALLAMTPPQRKKLRHGDVRNQGQPDEKERQYSDHAVESAPVARVSLGSQQSHCVERPAKLSAMSWAGWKSTAMCSVVL